MLLYQLQPIKSAVTKYLPYNCNRFYRLGLVLKQNAKPQVYNVPSRSEPTSIGVPESNQYVEEIIPAPSSRVMPLVLTNKEPVVLSFDDVPGPKALKYISVFRQYLSQIGTQLIAGFLMIGFDFGTFFNTRKPMRNLSSLFDKYGPVVRFVSPVGGDIVLLNHPEHIQKVYTMEGDLPVRSTLDSLEKYRVEHRNQLYGGLYSIHGEEWSRQRTAVDAPLHESVIQHRHAIFEVCESFVNKIYNMRNYQDEITKDLYKELHKWTFDCIGLVIFAKKFTMLDTELVYSQCDMSWLYHSLKKATEAIIKCENGLHLWKLVPTPAWNSLVKYCDSLDNLIGKHVLEAEQKLAFADRKELSESGKGSLIEAMLLSQDKMKTEDIATVLMDMLLLGVNTISSSMSFLLYFLATHQRVQKILYQEMKNVDLDVNKKDLKIKEETPYLQACIKETLRLVPPIPVLTRVLPKNITLDRYNIPRGTLIIMSTQDAALKESNYDDATKFFPERWLKPDANDYHAFASIPFGFGARKCIGQNVAETMMSLLTVQIMQKYKLEYHYGPIEPTRQFIAQPDKPLKIRFIDRN